MGVVTRGIRPNKWVWLWVEPREVYTVYMYVHCFVDVPSAAVGRGYLSAVYPAVYTRQK